MPLTVAKLTANRAGRPILRGVDASLSDGQALILVGPNGSGKSTFLKCLAGLLPSVHEALTIDGVALAADPDAYCERLAYAGHLDAVKPQLTVAENLAFWASLYGGDAAAGLAAFDLSAIADRAAHVCSAGQKRRLGLARILVAPRRLWLLDEPTVSLDEAAIRLLHAAIAAHCASGGMAVIATHVALGLAESHTLAFAPPPADRGSGGDPFLAGAFT